MQKAAEWQKSFNHNITISAIFLLHNFFWESKSFSQ